ncbi:hypothetical protein DJ568_06445 [Mucilaginibacter hurinus]|uniref:DUF4374 domain-containing protein n=1 Tax=Mucilaginibacter hurinus TaxID=2201324 RepID=A0A367GPZ3_9SPHI|nr:hypothetical protein [Mucilaginibacter hurinus]RCH55527.1 hypothetical protein DJ568_06445 [Mucilaginibacter hurinus]
MRFKLIPLIASVACALASCKKDIPARPAAAFNDLNGGNKIPMAATIPPQLLLVKGVGGMGEDEGRKIAIDAAGNVTVFGTFQQTVDFNPGGGVKSLTAPAGATAIFRQKFSSTGIFQDANSYGAATGKELFARDKDGNIYELGYEGDPGQHGFGTVKLTVFKYNDAGQLLKKVSLGNRYGAANNPRNILVDVDNNIVIHYWNELYKYTTNGALLWKKWIDPLQYLHLDRYGNIFNFSNGILKKYDKSGNLLLEKKTGGNTTAITFDFAGNIYLTGTIWGPGDFDPGQGKYELNGETGPAPGYGYGYIYDMFVQKLDANGNFIWARLGGFADPKCIALSANADYIYVSGSISYAAEFNTVAGKITLNSKSGDEGKDIVIMAFKQYK